MERWNRSILKIRRHQHREPNLKDITEFVEDETILMNDPLFSHEACREFNTKPEQKIKTLTGHQTESLEIVRPSK